MVRVWSVIAASALLLVSAGGAGLTARAQDLTPIAISAFNLDAPTALARATGTFQAAGFDVSVSITPSSTEQMRGLSNGTYDIAYTAFDNVLAWSGREGAEIVAVAQQDGDVTLPVYVRPEINDWTDLRGRPLAVDAADTAFALVLRRILLAHGLDLSNGDYTLVPLGATSARFDSMVNGDTFAAILNPPFNAQADKAGMRSFGDQHEVLPDYPGSVVAVRRDWAEANHDVLVSYLKAWREAGDFTQTDRDAAAQLYANEVNQPLPAAKGLLPARFNNGQINLAGLQSVLDLRNQFGYALPMGPNLDVYVDTSYWQATLDE